MEIGEVKTISERTEEEVRIQEKMVKVNQTAVLEAPWTAVLKDVQENLEPEYFELVSSHVTKGAKGMRINSRKIL